MSAGKEATLMIRSGRLERAIPVDEQDHAVADHLAFDQERAELRVGKCVVTTPRSDVPFTRMVKAIQAARGSRDAYAKVEARGGFHDRVSDDLAAFLAGVDTAFLATASADGQPYAQHRGGPKGFTVAWSCCR
jgi:Pyridoxamine 5'-phosphate oxidase